MQVNSTHVYSIGGLNRLPDVQKREIYTRMIPELIYSRFNLNPSLRDAEGRDLLTLNCTPGSTVAEMDLRHEVGFQDPLFYGHFTDTLSGQIHILLYIVNDPTSPRFDVDRMPDGTPTKFGIYYRHIEAEVASMQYGLAPGQIRRGLRVLRAAASTFEVFTSSLGYELYFADPLYYHNAILFERLGFAYQKGRKLMTRIQEGFAEGGDLLKKLDGSTPFRQPEAANSIRLRSWALHDGLLGEPFTDITMYKRINYFANLDSAPGCAW